MVSLDDLSLLEWLNATFRVLLAVVILGAGIGKLRDREGTRQAMGDFGTPPRWVPAASLALPALELLLSVGLVLDVTARWAAVGLAMLGAIFAGGIGNLLRKGHHPPCHCFGSLHSAPVGRGTLIRAILLALASVACAALPIARLNPSPLALLMSLGFLGLQARALDLLALRRARRAQQLWRFQSGQRLPVLKVEGGGTLQDVLKAAPTNILVFTSPSCGLCQFLKEPLARWAESYRSGFRVLAIEVTEAGGESDGPELKITGQTMKKLKLGTPAAVLVDNQGTLLEVPALGLDEVYALLRVGLAQASPARAGVI